jgi:hypothetical protein
MLESIEFRRPGLTDYQTAAMYSPARYSVIEATTKAGKTVACIVWLNEMAWLGNSGDNYWWVAPIYQQAKIAYRRMKDGLTKESFTCNETELFITLANGARIWFKGADNPDSLYGENVKAAVIDEASRVKEDAWHAVRSTLTQTRGKIRIIGNVKGRRNWAYKLARRAEHGEPDMCYHKITAHDAVKAGILHAEEIADAERMLPADVFRQLYLAEPSDDEGNPFGISAIQRCVERCATLTPSVAVAYGWDLAKSVDWTVGIGLDAAGCVSTFDRFQLPWEATIPRIKAVTIARRALVDSTGVGDPVLESLQKNNFGKFEGYKFSAPAKQMLMEGLAVAIQTGKVAFPAGVIADELEAFEYVYTRTGVHYSAPDGMTDDCVCALALAVQCYNGITLNAGVDIRHSDGRGDSEELDDYTVTPQGIRNDRVARFLAGRRTVIEKRKAVAV